MDAHLGFPTKKIIEEMAELADSHLVGDAQHLFGDGDSHWGFLLYQAVHLFVEAFLVVVGQSCRYQYLGQMVTFVKYSFAYLFNRSHKFDYRQQRAAFKGYIVDEVH